MQDLFTAIESVAEQDVKLHPAYDRLHTLRYAVTKNRSAAGIAFVSDILFISYGYKAIMEIYSLITSEITAIDGLIDFWQYLIRPIGVFALSAQLRGITVLFGTGFFAANRVNVGKFLVIIGTGQGLFTIGICVFSQKFGRDIYGELTIMLPGSRHLLLGLGSYSLFCHNQYLRGREKALDQRR